MGPRIIAKNRSIHPSARLGDDVEIVANELTIGENVTIGNHARLLAGAITLAADSVIAADADITAIESLALGPCGVLGPGLRANGRRLSFGSYFWSTRNIVIGGGGWQGPDANLIVGDHTTFVEGVFVNLSEQVTIGSDCALSADVAVLTHGSWQPVLAGFPCRFAPVTIEADVVVYVKSVILPGVSVRRGTTVAAGSVVAHDTPPYSLVGGVPARVIRGDVRRPLDADGRRELLVEVLGRYARTLPWKGAVVAEEPSSTSPRVVFMLDGVPCRIWLEHEPALRFVIWTGADHLCGFDLEAMAVSGVVGRVAEDLRDFLRRSGIKLFTDSPFRALPPVGLRALRALRSDPKDLTDSEFVTRQPTQ